MYSVYKEKYIEIHRNMLETRISGNLSSIHMTYDSIPAKDFFCFVNFVMGMYLYKVVAYRIRLSFQNIYKE